MSMNAREAAGVLAQCKWLRDNISRWEAAAKDVLARELVAGERIAAIAPDGTNLGSVTRTMGARSMQVDNEAGFVAWVEQRYPTEIERVVRPAFLKLCGEKVKSLGALPDANGEMCPHVSRAQADPYAKVTLADDADMQMLRMVLQRPLMEVITPESELSTDTGDVQLTQYEGRPWVDEPPEEFIEEGPPNWAESNTFESSPAVKDKRG